MEPNGINCNVIDVNLISLSSVFRSELIVISSGQTSLLAFNGNSNNNIIVSIIY